MRSVLPLALLWCVAPLSAPVQASAQKVELFGGYSYLRPSVPATVTIVCPAPPCPSGSTAYNPDLNGWEFAATFKPKPIIGITADFSGHYGSVIGTSMHEQTYLFGPKINLPLGFYVHALAGDAHQSFNGASQDAFAAALGGGLDVKPRISAGLVLRF